MFILDLLRVILSKLHKFFLQVKSLREVYSKCISDKHEDGIAKFGAILAQGIIDAGINQMSPFFSSDYKSISNILSMFS